MLFFLGFSLFASYVAHALVHPFSASVTAEAHRFCLETCPISEHVELYRAIVCGKSPTASDLRVDFARTGLIHLLVVSGQHFLVLESLLDFLTRKLPSAVRSILTLFVLGAFLVATGVSPPALRAMFSWCARGLDGRLHFGWSPTQTNLLAVVCVVPFCHDVNELFSLALSGTAAAALAATPLRTKTATLIEKLRSAVATQTRLYVMLIPALSPIVFPHPLSIVWNLTVGTLIGQILFPVSLAALTFPVATRVANSVWSVTLGVVSKIAEWTPSLPRGPSPPVLFAIAYAMIVFVWMIARERKLRTSLLVLSIAIARPVAAGEVVVWNVGQGSWATVVHEDACLHFDTGGEFAPWQLIESACRGLANEAYYSHWDWDHVGFARRASESLGVCIRAHPGGHASATRMKLLDGIESCSGPLAQALVEHTNRNRTKKTSNAASRVFSSEKTIFTGDVTRAEERSLVSLTKTRVLVVAHHGSKTSSSEEFLARVTPRMAIVSARRERYGHPHREVVERMKRSGIAVILTEDWGSVRIETDRR